jgi:N-acetylglucosamine kinase-like BadF-type ATPase
MNYVIGVDQGGSGTRAVICALDGRILGVGAGPGACHVFSGMEAAMQATQTAVQAALAQAEMPLGQEAALFTGGYTGADWPDEYDLLRAAVESLGLARSVRIVNDSIAALRGGTAQPYGAILVAGTGANCALRAPDGREFIYHYYHDEDLQGGGAIGRATLKAICRAETGRPPQPSLRARVLAFFGRPDVDTLIRDLVEGRLPYDCLPEIAPLVFEEAARGDLVAQKIIVHFGEGCAELLVNGLRRLDMLDLELEIVLSGGIFKAKSALLRQILEQDVKTGAPRARFIEARYEPVIGATLLALESLGIVVWATIQENIERTAQRWGLVRTGFTEG